MSEFDFDCPGYFVNLKTESQILNDAEDEEGEIWFSVKHALHENPSIGPISDDNSRQGKLSMPVKVLKADSEVQTLQNELKQQSIPKKTSVSVTTTFINGKTKGEKENFKNTVLPRKQSTPMMTADSLSRQKQTGNLPKHTVTSAQSKRDFGSTFAAVKDSFSKNKRHTTASLVPSSHRGDRLKNTTSRSLDSDDLELGELLAKHNQRFKQTTYEPPRHSVRDVRRWEKETGKIWANLNPQDREKANGDIDLYKKAIAF